MAKDRAKERREARSSHYDNLHFILRTIVSHYRILGKGVIISILERTL